MEMAGGGGGDSVPSSRIISEVDGVLSGDIGALLESFGFFEGNTISLVTTDLIRVSLIDSFLAATCPIVFWRSGESSFGNVVGPTYGERNEVILLTRLSMALGSRSASSLILTLKSWMVTSRSRQNMA